MIFGPFCAKQHIFCLLTIANKITVFYKPWLFSSYSFGILSNFYHFYPYAIVNSTTVINAIKFKSCEFPYNYLLSYVARNT